MSLLSIVVPVYNEEDSIQPFIENLVAALQQLNRDWEIILVDDGSEDATPQRLAELKIKHPNKIVCLALSRNFGQSAALAAGIDHCRGEIVATLDADGQNDPADLKILIEVMNRNGCDVVCGWRKDRQDGSVRVFASNLANQVISRITGIALHDYGCTLRIYRKPVLDDVQLMGDMHRLLPAYLAWRGASIAEEPVRHHPRRAGRSKYGLVSRTLKVFLDAFLLKFYFSYFTRPMHFFGSAAILSLLMAFLIECFVVFRRLYYHGDWLSPMFFLGFFFAVVSLLFLFMGALADLLVRNYAFTRKLKPYHLK